MGSSLSQPTSDTQDFPADLRAKVSNLLAASAVESENTVTTSATTSDPTTPNSSNPDESSSSSTEPLQSFSDVVDKKSKSRSGRWWWGIERSELPNPGSYDEMAQDAQIVLRQNLIEGLQFNMILPQSANLATGIMFDMGAKDRPGQFGSLVNYFTNSTVVMSKFTPSDCALSGRIFYRHTPNLTSRVQANVTLMDLAESKGDCELDYRGPSYCAQLKFAGGGVCALSYLQSVTPWLALGGEGFFQTKTAFSAITFAGKYFHGKDTASVTVAAFGPIFATYCRKVNEKVTLASELFVDSRTRDSHVQLGYKFDLKHATCTGVITSEGKVSAVVEEKINPGLSLILSGELDHQREDYKFGFGINFGQ